MLETCSDTSDKSLDPREMARVRSWGACPENFDRVLDVHAPSMTSISKRGSFRNLWPRDVTTVKHKPNIWLELTDRFPNIFGNDCDLSLINTPRKPYIATLHDWRRCLVSRLNVEMILSKKMNFFLWKTISFRAHENDGKKKMTKDSVGEAQSSNPGPVARTTHPCPVAGRWWRYR